MTNKANKNDGISIYQVIYNIQRDIATKIKTNATNPFHKSKYIDLYKLMEVLMPYFGEYNILITHSIGTNNLETKLVKLDTGEEYAMTSSFDTSRLDAQQLGSYITYMRRYAICCLFGIVADKDDDGNTASGITPTKLSAKSAEPNKDVLSDKEMNSPTFINNNERDMFISHMTPEEVVEKRKKRYVITQWQEDTMLRGLYTKLFEHERELEERNNKNEDTKKPLSSEEMLTEVFTSTIDKYLKDGISPKEILDKIKVKYTLTQDQENTILNLK